MVWVIHFVLCLFLSLTNIRGNKLLISKKIRNNIYLSFLLSRFCSTSYGIYISQLIRFARASSHVTDFNTHNKLLTQKLLKQVYRFHKLRKTFSKLYRRYYDWYLNFKLGLKLSCPKNFRNLNSMVTWCINWRRLLALIIFQRSSLK